MPNLRIPGLTRRMVMAQAGLPPLIVVTLAAAFSPAPMHAQQPAPARPRDAAVSPGSGRTAGPQQAAAGEVQLTAASANVDQPGNPIRMRILRWSTDDERKPILAALNPEPPPAPAATGERGGAGRAGRAGAGRAGRAGRGGRGDVPATPTARLTTAISGAPTLGYIWTDGVTGYSIKYAWHAPLPGGGERIVLATDRRLGAHVPGWKPVAPAPPTDYEFTLIEMRLDAKGAGEGKTSLTTKVVVDNDAQTVALEDYASAPAILQNVKR